MSLIVQLGVPLASTILIEYGILRLLKENRRKILAGSALINIITNVPLNYFFAESDFCVILWAEVAIVTIEMLWYLIFLKEFKTALIYSLLCNAVSFLSGLLFFLIFSLCF